MYVVMIASDSFYHASEYNVCNLCNFSSKTLTSSRESLSYDDCVGLRGKITRTAVSCVVYNSCAQ